MSTYTVRPGIAALVHVTCETFPERYGSKSTAFIYMAEGKPIERGIADPIEFGDLPADVRASIEAHFDAVFALPVEDRGEYLATLTPWEITA